MTVAIANKKKKKQRYNNPRTKKKILEITYYSFNKKGHYIRKYIEPKTKDWL